MRSAIRDLNWREAGSDVALSFIVRGWSVAKAAVICPRNLRIRGVPRANPHLSVFRLLIGHSWSQVFHVGND